MKKDILLVINTLGRAGAENAMLALINKLDPNKFNIDVYVLLNQGEMVTELPEHIKLLNKKYCNESVLSGKGKKKLVYNTLKRCLGYGSVFKNIPFLIANLIRCIKDGKKVLLDKLLWRVISDGSMRIKKEYDLAIAYLEGGAAYYVCDHVKAKKKAGFIHIDYEKAGYTKELDKDCYTKFDRVFTVSDEVKEHFLKVYTELENKTYVLHNFLNEEAIREKSKKECDWGKGPGLLKTTDNCKKLLTVGRLTYQKGYDIAIDALKLLIERGYNVSWLVLGDGPERKMLEDKVKALKLEEHFLMPGAVDNPYPYLKAADIYVHATRFEGKSIAIQEAQILGKAIVASNCSGNIEQIESGVDGLLCSMDKVGIADAIQKLIDNPGIAREYGLKAGLKKINHVEELQLIYDLVAVEMG